MTSPRSGNIVPLMSMAVILVGEPVSSPSLTRAGHFTNVPMKMLPKGDSGVPQPGATTRTRSGAIVLTLDWMQILRDHVSSPSPTRASPTHLAQQLGHLVENSGALSAATTMKFPNGHTASPQGKSYSACTKEGAADDQLWCALTPNYDKDSKWKACASQEYEGNSKGQPCVFPFIYKSRTFYTCTNEDAAQGRFWCATTGSYDKDKQWSYCADTRLSSRPTGPCIFPFTYKSKSHSSCTTDGSSDEKPWCSLTKNYDVDQKWTYCDPAGDSNQTGKDHGCL
ncbi:epididymal sperm-binding protein 1-like isoform X5 [Hemicordylus capensis]|nr:epididymal sperm-binding protein 1-like isoform X5 [Hemicordylus capensis]XP_053119001.1 epididymal sperm-binding protein 1-like isoform X5 [Hemicordylus capensis]XP_053119002.1 epididymal sperm-binding protein 1-like isoform X5 [Hemicordylus capensis]